jgi:hypothetical protein
MSEDLSEEPFESASQKVEDSYQVAVAELKSKVEKAKSSALKKLAP